MNELFDKMNQTAQEYFNRTLNDNNQAAKRDGNIMQALADASKYLPMLQTTASQYPMSEVYNPPRASAIELPDPLDPSKTGANRPFIEEDRAAIEKNLASSEKPITTEEMARALAESWQQLVILAVILAMKCSCSSSGVVF